MLRKLIPVLLALSGAAFGLGAGFALRAPAPDMPPVGEAAADPAAAAEPAAAEADAAGAEGAPTHEYVKLNNQFVVPVVQHGKVAAVVAISLSLEVKPGETARVYELEPKLRDGLLQVMFDHANSGGFDGTFTDGANMVVLRQALREIGARIFGKDLTDVLIVDIVRQDNQG